MKKKEHFKDCCNEFIDEFCCMGLLEYKLFFNKASKNKPTSKPKEVKYCPYCNSSLFPLTLDVNQVWMHPFTLHNWLITEIDNAKDYPIRAIDQFTKGPNRFLHSDFRGWKFVR